MEKILQDTYTFYKNDPFGYFIVFTLLFCVSSFIRLYLYKSKSKSDSIAQWIVVPSVFIIITFLSIRFPSWEIHANDYEILAKEEFRECAKKVPHDNYQVMIFHYRTIFKPCKDLILQEKEKDLRLANPSFKSKEQARNEFKANILQ